jgi:GR25 family glycosyltransferase involved in LPS biosynthesis
MFTWRRILSCLLVMLTAVFFAGSVVGLQLLRAADQPQEVTSASIAKIYKAFFGDEAALRCAGSTWAENCVQIPNICKKFATNRLKDVRYSKSSHSHVTQDWYWRGLCWPKQELWLPGIVEGTAVGRPLLASERCEPYAKWKAEMKPPRWLAERKSAIPAYYINLPDSTDRDTKTEAVLRQIVKQFTRIEAVDSNTPGFHERIAKVLLDSGYHEGEQGTPSYPTAAILVSHRRAIQAAFDKGDDMAFIFEDDISLELASSWSESLDSFAASLPAGWMAAQLGYSRFASLPSALVTSPTPVYYRTLFQRAQHGAEAGAFAYLINRGGMERVLSQSLSEVMQRCSLFTADECLLGFSRLPPLSSQGPMAGHVFLATPPFFTVDLDGSRRLSGFLQKSKAHAGHCGSLHANAVTDRYTCTNQARADVPDSGKKSAKKLASPWVSDGCLAEYYIDTNAAELESILGDLADLTLAELERHYMRRGKREGMRCSPCPKGQQLENTPRAWWMTEGDSLTSFTSGWGEIPPTRGAPISLWPVSTPS